MGAPAQTTNTSMLCFCAKKQKAPLQFHVCSFCHESYYYQNTLFQRRICCCSEGRITTTNLQSLLFSFVDENTMNGSNEWDCNTYRKFWTAVMTVLLLQNTTDSRKPSSPMETASPTAGAPCAAFYCSSGFSSGFGWFVLRSKTILMVGWYQELPTSATWKWTNFQA